MREQAHLGLTSVPKKIDPLAEPVVTRDFAFQGKSGHLEMEFCAKTATEILTLESPCRRGFWEEVRNVCIGDSKSHTGI